MLTKEALGERIKQLMKDKGLTQKVLSEKVGITQAKLSNYVNGKNYPPIDVLAQLSESLNVTIDYLVNGTTTNESVPESEKQYTFNSCGDIARMLISLFSVVDTHICGQSETYEKIVSSPDADIYSRERRTLSRMRYYITFGGRGEWDDEADALNGFLGRWVKQEERIEQAVDLLNKIPGGKEIGQSVQQILPSWKREQARELDSIPLLDLFDLLDELDESECELPDDDGELPF